MRFVRPYIQAVLSKGEEQYTLLSFDEFPDTAQLVGCFLKAKGKQGHMYVELQQIDFDHMTLQSVSPTTGADRPKSAYLGKVVRTQSGRYMGRVVDLGFEEAGGRILELVSAKHMLGMQYGYLHIPRNAVVKVTKRQIIVEDATVREGQREKGRLSRMAPRPVASILRWIIRQP